MDREVTLTQALIHHYPDWAEILTEQPQGQLTIDYD
jgi:hypothetical protein